MIRLSHRCQRTISRAVRVDGVGYLTGTDVGLRMRPAEPDTGIVFIRTDLKPHARIVADVSQVSGTARRTTLGSGSRSVTLVEHVVSALAGLRVDNCIIELDAPEPPGLDGSAGPFVDAILDAGIEIQEAKRYVYSVTKPVVVKAGSSTLALHPTVDEELTVSYMLDYGPRAPIDRQIHTQHITPGEYAEQIASCRTFVLESEALAFRQAGIGLKTTARDLLVFGPQGVIENKLRFANEPARHKILDLIGDLALCGLDIRGHVVAYRSGHPLNVELARTIAARHAQPAARPAVGGYFRQAA